MYQEPSPIFDLHEFPTLRRVKPLPKRRRTMATATTNGPTAPSTPFLSATLPLDMLGDSMTDSMSTEQLIAHAEEISKKISQSLYMNNLNNLMAGNAVVGGASSLDSTQPPSAASSQILSDVELLSEAALNAQGLPAEIFRSLTEKLSLPGFPPPFSSPAGRVDFDAIYAAGYEAGLSGAGLRSKYTPFYRSQYHASTESSAQGTASGEAQNGDGGAGGDINVTVEVRRHRGGREEEEEEEDGDGDYMDHLRQPGNTKKRKVPTNAGMSPLRGREDVVDNDGAGSTKRCGPDGGYDEGGGGGNQAANGDPGDHVADAGGRLASYISNTGHLTSPRTGRLPLSALSTATTSASSAARVGQLNNVVKVRGKLTAAMVAGLQHKEMLKARKRQLAAVMGALTQGDSMALDQALSMAGSAYPFGGPLGLPPSTLKENNALNNQVKTRFSKRTPARLARVVKAKRAIPRHPDEKPLPTSAFSFQCPSPTADRLLATKQEVVTLRRRFEAELERQAKKAAKLAAASKMLPPASASTTLTRTSKKKAEKGHGKRVNGGARSGQPPQQPYRPQQAQQQSSRNPQSQQKTGGGQQAHTADGTGPLQNTPSKPKKKKRSALANASNPHHLKNYVPSRLPHSGGGTHNPNAPTNAHNLFGPLPYRFLNANLPPKRGSKKNHARSGSVQGSVAASGIAGSLSGVAEEWICMFCEYDLFYGDDVAFRRALKNRKKILKRRRRAKERVAAAASGFKTFGGGAKNGNGSSHQPPPVSGFYANTGEEFEEGDEFDGDPGYEVGGNGKDEHGNVPKHQTGRKDGGGTVGGGVMQNGQAAGQVAPAG